MLGCINSPVYTVQHWRVAHPATYPLCSPPCTTQKLRLPPRLNCTQLRRLDGRLPLGQTRKGLDTQTLLRNSPRPGAPEACSTGTSLTQSRKLLPHGWLHFSHQLSSHML